MHGRREEDETKTKRRELKGALVSYDVRREP
jgi:hypothetical protein